jgi:hypothetical protein
MRPASTSALSNGTMPPAANFLMMKGGMGSNLSSTPEEMLVRRPFSRSTSTSSPCLIASRIPASSTTGSLRSIEFLKK